MLLCVRFFLLSTKDLSWIELLTTLYTTRELPINPNWKINWVIDGFDTSQEIPRGIASLSSNPQYFNSNLNFPVTGTYSKIECSNCVTIIDCNYRYCDFKILIPLLMSFILSHSIFKQAQTVYTKPFYFFLLFITSNYIAPASLF